MAFSPQQSVHELEVRTAQATVGVLPGRMPDFTANLQVLPDSRVRIAWSRSLIELDHWLRYETALGKILWKFREA